MHLRGGKTLAKAIAVALVALLAGSRQGFAQPRALFDLTLEELGNLTVTSVSRRPEPLLAAPASVFVITADDIRRSGARTLPEALRLAPSLNVARINATDYAITARGFNNAVGNKLLVLIDGRTVYTPVFSGVFWDQQDVLLEDVERIEVISGPGATLWGANAVNGVINVITRSAGETQGPLVTAGAGNLEEEAVFRYGGRVNEDAHFRLYAKARETENTRTAAGIPNPDGRTWMQAGLRSDVKLGRDTLTLQGDAYEGRSEDRGSVFGIPLRRVEVSGVNLLGRITRELAGGSTLRLQAYVDQFKRKDPVLLQPDVETFDLELQHALPKGKHAVVWGAGYRRSRDNIPQGFLAGFRPQSRTLEWWNLFAQDEIALAERLSVTLGMRIDHNDYTGAEYLPTARLAWHITEEALVWASASRAVRAPARYDRDVFSPFFPSLGGPNFESEVANVFELGYRARAGSRFTWSATLFRHEWDRLRSGTTLPLTIENRLEGPVYGLEAWATWQPVPSWRLTGGLTTIEERLELETGSTDPLGARNVTLANDPDYHWMLRSSLNLPWGHEFDVMLRRVAALPVEPVPAYTALNLRYGMRLRPGIELSVTLQNALDHRHPEFRTSALPPTEIERSLFVALRWTP